MREEKDTDSKFVGSITSLEDAEVIEQDGCTQQVLGVKEHTSAADVAEDLQNNTHSLQSLWYASYMLGIHYLATSGEATKSQVYANASMPHKVLITVNCHAPKTSSFIFVQRAAGIIKPLQFCHDNWLSQSLYPGGIRKVISKLYMVFVNITSLTFKITC